MKSCSHAGQTKAEGQPRSARRPGLVFAAIWGVGQLAIALLGVGAAGPMDGS
jgi:hypothetical protein